MKKLYLLLSLFISINCFSQENGNPQKFASIISANDLKVKLSIIAGAEMEGRETATPGQQKAAAYIENFFKQIGLLPCTPKGYQLYFPVYQDSITDLALDANGTNFSNGKDYAIGSVGEPTGSWSTDSIVFASFKQDSTIAHFENNDVKNKWLMVTEDDGTVSNKAKILQAKNLEAAGLLIVSKDFPKKTQMESKGIMYDKQGDTLGIPVFYISYHIASTILNKQLNEFADLKNIETGTYASKLFCSITVARITLHSSNVIGVLPGTDLKDQYIFLTAHYDHLGKKDSVIYYGADDDGSGTASVLELAEAFTAAKQEGDAPRRTMVFMTVSGEEEGLWGSDYYMSNPIFPLNKTSVDLNIDMVGRIDPKRKQVDSDNYVYTIGEDKLSSDLIKISDSINNKYAHLDLDRKFNDPNDPERFYYRSDHYNFAKHGVPVIFYFNGTHPDYHRPTDTVEKINFGLMEKRVQLVFFTAWDMANRNEMLKRDIPLN